MRQAKYQVFKGRRGFFWRLRAANGKIVATGGEWFSTRANATRAAMATRRASAGARSAVEQVR